MTKNYQRDHEEIVWSGAIPDLNISENHQVVLRQLCAVCAGTKKPIYLIGLTV